MQQNIPCLKNILLIFDIQKLVFIFVWCWIKNLKIFHNLLSFFFRNSVPPLAPPEGGPHIKHTERIKTQIGVTPTSTNFNHDLTPEADTIPGTTYDHSDDLNIGLIVGIAAGVLVALIVLIIALYKFRSRDEGSYKIDESQNFAYLDSKQQQSNGALLPHNNTAGGGGKSGKKKDVKEWYV